MNFRIPEQLRLEGLSEGWLVSTLLKPEWSRAGCSGSSPVSIWIYYTSVQGVPVFDYSKIKKGFLLCVNGIPCIWICAHCVFSCQTKRVCLSHLYSMSFLSWAVQNWAQHCKYRLCISLLGRFLLAHFSCILISLWMAAKGSVTPSSVYPADLLMMCHHLVLRCRIDWHQIKKVSAAVSLVKTVISEGYRAGQVLFHLWKSMLIASNHFFVLCMFGSSFLEDLLHHILTHISVFPSCPSWR